MNPPMTCSVSLHELVRSVLLMHTILVSDNIVEGMYVHANIWGPQAQHQTEKISRHSIYNITAIVISITFLE